MFWIQKSSSSLEDCWTSGPPADLWVTPHEITLYSALRRWSDVSSTLNCSTSVFDTGTEDLVAPRSGRGLVETSWSLYQTWSGSAVHMGSQKHLVMFTTRQEFLQEWRERWRTDEWRTRDRTCAGYKWSLVWSPFFTGVQNIGQRMEVQMFRMLEGRRSPIYCWGSALWDRRKDSHTARHWKTRPSPSGEPSQRLLQPSLSEASDPLSNHSAHTSASVII